VTGGREREAYYRHLDELLLHTGASGHLLSVAIAWGATELSLRAASGGAPRDTPTVIALSALSWLWIAITTRTRDRRRRGATTPPEP
jgi:hypothetical protein